MSETALTIFRDARKARYEGPAGIARRQCTRLTDQIAYVRAHSRYYRELYQHLPERIEDVTLLPVTNKQKLTEHFYDWVTDPELSQQRDAGSMVAKRIFPVTMSMPELVEQLNGFRPVYVECYPTIGALLASEQEAGRLRIRPALLRLGGEGLTDGEYERIRTAFGAKILDLYGANEFPALMVKCSHGWYHTHDDWMVFEPVDANYQPTPPGEQSHTVLASVLYRREQPILRYDVGDSILVRPDPCPCGSPFSAVKVRGRVPILLNFRTADGRTVILSSFVVSLQVARAAGVELFQIIQTTPSTLSVRLQSCAWANPDQVWYEVRAKLARMFSDHGLSHVVVDRGTEPPKLSPGGKLRSVIPLVAHET